MSWFRNALWACLVGVCVASAHAETATFDAPGIDRWSYPFAGNGSEQEARIFSALGTEGFDERDAQFIVAFDTTAGGSSSIPAFKGALNYEITSVKLTATVSSLVGAPTYDGTHDNFQTYLATDAAAYVPDADAGRPIELFGAAFVGGYTEFGFGPTDGAPPAYEEANPFGFGPPNGRYVHPVAINELGERTMASNNVDYFNGGADGWDATPYAVGTSSLNAGDPLAVGTELTFDVNLSDPAILDHMRQSLNDGQLGFVFSTLALSNDFPRLYTKEFPGGSPVTLQVEYRVVPEPNTLVLSGLTFAAVGCVVLRQWRRKSA